MKVSQKSRRSTIPGSIELDNIDWTYTLARQLMSGSVGNIETPHVETRPFREGYGTPMIRWCRREA